MSLLPIAAFKSGNSPTDSDISFVFFFTSKL